MKKLAIIGIDNSHAWHFARYLDGKDGTKVFDDVELIGVWGDYATEDGKVGAEEIKNMSNCTVFAEHYNDFLDTADAVMITARHGKYHLEYAKEYIKRGIPVWVDKPITCSGETVCEMIELAKKHNCILTGGSNVPFIPQVKALADLAKSWGDTLNGGHVTAPIIMESPYGKFWFYAQHLIQMITSIFGNDIKSVYAVEAKGGVHAIYRYADYAVTAFFGTDYTITLYKEGWSALEQERIVIDDDCYLHELKAFHEVLQSGKNNMTPQDIAAPVFVLEATLKSYTEGKEIEITLPY